MQSNSKGERGGRHSNGYQILSPLTEEFWHTIPIAKPLSTTPQTTISSSSCIKIRRNIVLDADDQRMQLTLCLYKSPAFVKRNVVGTTAQTATRTNGNHNSNSSNKWTITFTLALLTMEEDEAADSGFPTLLHNAYDDDEDQDQHLICTSESRFQYSYWQVIGTRAKSSTSSSLTDQHDEEVNKQTQIEHPHVQGHHQDNSKTNDNDPFHDWSPQLRRLVL